MVESKSVESNNSGKFSFSIITETFYQFLFTHNQIHSCILGPRNSTNAGKNNSDSDSSKSNESTVGSGSDYIGSSDDKKAKAKVDDSSSEDSSVVNSLKGGLSDGDSNASDSDAPKILFDISQSALGKQLKKQSDKLEHAQGDSEGTIFNLIRSQVKGMSHGIALFGLPKRIWFLNPLFISGHCISLFSANYPNKEVPKFLKNIFRWNIRKEHHGDNSLARTAKGKAVAVIGFVFEIPTSQESKAKKLVNKHANLIRACFMKTDKYSIGTLALDYIEEHSNEDPLHPGTKAGLYRTLTKGITDTTGIEARLTKDINDYFLSKKTFESNVHWDKFLTDVDIKEFLENCLGANNWDMVPVDVRKACYKNYKSVNSLPVWNQITREGY